MSAITVFVGVFIYFYGIFQQKNVTRLESSSTMVDNHPINVHNISNAYLFSRRSMNFIIVRSVLSVISISLTTFALKNMSISDVYAVYYIYPAVVILLSYIFLKESVGWFDYLCLASCFIGVILVIRPEFIFSSELTNTKNAYSFMFILVMVGAILKACEDIIIRNVGTDVHCLIIPSIYSVVSVILYPVTMTLTNEVKAILPEMSFFDVFLIMCIAICSFIYQTFMTLGIQNENAGRVSMVNYFQVPFMFLSDIFIFNKNVIFCDILGTMLIFSFNFANGIKKAIKRTQELDSYRNMQKKNKEFEF
jgi:drug/metabolite transporter (DMT)-like permease